MSRGTRGGFDSPLSLFSFQDIITSLTGIMVFFVLMLCLDVINRRAGAPVTPARASDSAGKQAASVSGSELERLRARVAELEAALAALPMTAKPVETVNALALARALIAAEERNRKEASRKDEIEKLLRDLDLDKKLLADKVALTTDEVAVLQRRVQQAQMALAREQSLKRVFFIPEKGSAKTPVLVECAQQGWRAGVLGSPRTVQAFPAGRAGRSNLIDYLKNRDAKTECVVLLVKPSAAEGLMACVNEVRTLGFDVGYDPVEEDCTITLDAGSGAPGTEGRTVTP